jgi:hypothetical protein
MAQVALLPIIRRINITFGVLEPEQVPVAMEEDVEQETVRARCLCARSASESARVCLTVRCKVTMAFFITFPCCVILYGCADGDVRPPRNPQIPPLYTALYF